MQASATIKPSKSLQKNLKNLQKGPELLQKKIDLAALRIEGIAKRNLQQVSSGDRVTRYSPPKGKRVVIVSRPGDPPNSDTFTAIKSIRHDTSNGATVGTRLKYLAQLEFDSVSTKRKARPWLVPAIKEFMKKHGGKFFIFKFPRVP